MLSPVPCSGDSFNIKFTFTSRMADCLLISEQASVFLLGPVRELIVLNIEAGIGPVLGVMLLDEVFSFVPSFVSHLELVH